MRSAPTRLAPAAVLATLLAACASGDSTPPAALTGIAAPLPVQARWHVALGDGRGTFLRPAVVENAVYGASAAGELVRIDPATGTVQWRVHTDTPLGAGVGSDGFTVAVAGARGEVYAYGADGKALWRALVPSDVASAPLVGHDLVIVRSTDQRVSAFDAATGKRRWVFEKQQPSLSLRVPRELAFGDDSVLVGYPGGRLVSIALANGAQRWEAAVSEPRGATEVERLADVVGVLGVGDKQVCAASYQGRIGCFDAASGEPRWTRDFSAGAGVATGAALACGVDAADSVQCFSRDNGARLWQNAALAHRRLGSPALFGRLLAVGDFEGYVHFLSLADGALVSRFRSDGSAIAAAPVAAFGGLVVQTGRGELMLLQSGN